MQIPVLPIIGVIFALSVVVRGEMLRLTRDEYGYVLADIASIVCFVLLSLSYFATLNYYQYKPDWLLRVSITRKRLVDLSIFIVFLLGYVYFLAIFGGEIFDTRFAPVWISLPILIAAGILELRWKKDVEMNSQLGD